MAEAYYYASAILQSNVFFLFKFYHWMRNDFYKSKGKKNVSKIRGHPLIPHFVHIFCDM